MGCGITPFRPSQRPSRTLQAVRIRNMAIWAYLSGRAAVNAEDPCRVNEEDRKGGQDCMIREITPIFGWHSHFHPPAHIIYIHTRPDPTPIKTQPDGPQGILCKDTGSRWSGPSLSGLTCTHSCTGGQEVILMVAIYKGSASNNPA